MSREPGTGLRRHLTSANVISTLAVFLVLAGGTALAAGLPKNSVSSKTVKNNSLQSADLADGSGVSGADVADGSLGGADVADGSLGGGDLADGSLSGADLADGSIGGADLGKGAVGPETMAPNSVTGRSVRDGSLTGADVGADTLTGRNIDESTLALVPNASTLGGKPVGRILSGGSFAQGSSPTGQGIPIGDGTFKITESCAPTPARLLSGGPLLLNPTTTLVESFPKNGTWTVRINPHGIPDEFAVRVICVLQDF